MRIGINALNFGPGTTPEALVRWAELAEDGGFDFLSTSDHVAVTPDVTDQYPPPFYDPFLTLGFLAGITRRIRLGTTVLIVPYRHPLHVARLAANLDQFSGGRLILGVASGWARQEFAALGADFDRRGEVTDEFLRVIREAWQQPTVSSDGPTHRFADVATGPPPRQQPHPPVWVGGNSARAMRRAVELGDAWHPIGPKPGWLRSHGIPALVRAAEAHGAEVPPVAPRLELRFTDTPLPDDARAAGVGTPDQIEADLDDLADLGIEDVLFDTYDGVSGAITTGGHHEDGWRQAERLASLVL